MRRKYSKNLIISLVLGLVVVNVFGMLWVGSLGGEIIGLEKEIDEQEKMNLSINDEIVKYNGLTELKKKAQNLGYFHPENIIYSKHIEDVSLAK